MNIEKFGARKACMLQGTEPNPDSTQTFQVFSEETIIKIDWEMI